MLALGLIGARVRIAVFVFLYFGVLGRILLSVSCILGCILLSLSRVFGRVLLGLCSVFSRILVLRLCGTRDYQTRKSNTEQATSNESIQHFWSPVRNFVAHFYSTDKTRKPERSRGHWPLKVTCPCGQARRRKLCPLDGLAACSRFVILRYAGAQTVGPARRVRREPHVCCYRSVGGSG